MLITILKNFTKKNNDTDSFNKTPPKYPINVPIAANSAILILFIFTVNSPINAPKKEPNKIPIGPNKKIPITNPIVEPMTPALLPPNFLAPIEGIK